MTQMPPEQIAAKLNRIIELGDTLKAELADGKPFGLGREFAVAITNLETALLWASVGLFGALHAARDSMTGDA